MKTVTQHIRDSILRNSGYYKTPSPEELRKSEWSVKFENLMKNRLVMGALRYGIIQDESRSRGQKRTDYMQKKLDLYVEDGNAEHLVDIANFCIAEFREENHPKFHFNAKDDKGHM